MFPFWELAIAPILDAAEVRRVVEVGALRGENTRLMLDRLGPDVELHVIDPLPEFDPEEHAKLFGGQYVFHQDLSLNALPRIGAVDAALIDGDHNWYTVYNELKVLAEQARLADAPLPVLIMHDVGWPYGRRDLYYAPEQIPDEFRQPWARGGMQPGRSELKVLGGLNPTMANAMHEGGPRNGVMTAIDDFIAEHDKPLVMLVLPIYFGLAIVVEQERLDRQPALAKVLEELEGNEAKDGLLHLAEDVRIKAMLYQHKVVFQRDSAMERAAKRYLGILKASLLDEHYLENELRLAALETAVAKGRTPAYAKLRDPSRDDKDAYGRLALGRQVGPVTADGTAASSLPYTDMGRFRLDHVERCLDAVRDGDVPGDLAECGTGRGGGAIFLRGYLQAYELEDRQVWVADRFHASAPSDAAADPSGGFAAQRPDLNMVRDGFARFELLDDTVHFLQGEPAATLPDAPITELALLRVTGGAEDVTVALRELYDRVAVGGSIIVDGRGDAAAVQAVEAFHRDRGIATVLERVDAAAVVWRKVAGEADAPAVQTEPVAVTADRAPLAPTLLGAGVDLSVVIVVYNMRREAERSLHSLSRAYQLGIDDISYEVIVVENGSAPDQKLGEDFVARFGPEFRYLDLGDDAQPSPAYALNQGIRAARGKAFALMIDGAHVLTPGVLKHGLTGLEAYAPAIVATQQWYVGPGQQGDAISNGYDQEYEDRLFDEIKWPTHGYGLFSIGHFVGDRDWFDGLWESNCIFVRRPLLQQAGGFDESFDTPGGGYANLDLYERLGAAAMVKVASILGEASFHQVHGGTTTNEDDALERRNRVYGYGQQYAEMRGRPFKGPGKPIHYVGALLYGNARRTKARRMSPDLFTKAMGGRDGLPFLPRPVPDELKDTFTDAVWHNLPWRQTTWLGQPIEVPPTDLLAYQEIISTVRPDWIIESGSGSGARALFLASICDLVGHGKVLSIDEAKDVERPEHERIRYLAGRLRNAKTAADVTSIVGDAPHGMVILGARQDRRNTLKEFETLAPMVSVGSYLVVENTVINGHPVWPNFGPGPAEAVKGILNGHGEFAADPTMEKYSLTFNPNGFLKRLR
ncbi:MAG: hypothetical protein JWM05_1598 [Acidimicrobiales bacterium]|nr:hypothetical protein [Acidimicrobiales bacterium]